MLRTIELLNANKVPITIGETLTYTRARMYRTFIVYASARMDKSGRSINFVLTPPIRPINLRSTSIHKRNIITLYSSRVSYLVRTRVVHYCANKIFAGRAHAASVRQIREVLARYIRSLPPDQLHSCTYAHARRLACASAVLALDTDFERSLLDNIFLRET